MKKILLTGSSHAAAVFSGWKEIQSEYPDVTVEILAFPSYSVRHIERRPNGLYGIFNTDAFKTQVRNELIKAYGSLTRNLNDFSHVIVAGRELNLTNVMSLLVSAGLQGVRPCAALRPALISRPAFRAFCRQALKPLGPDNPYEIFSGLKTFVLAEPRRSETVIDGPEGQIREVALGLKQDPEGILDALAICFDTARAVYAESGIELVTQPMETLCDFGFTKSEYNRASVNIRSTLVKGEAHMPTDDYAHMNAQYGALVLRQVLDSLDAA